MVSHNLQQQGAAEAGDVKFAVEQRMGSAVMLLQEVRNWPGGQGVLSGYEFYTDIDLDTAVAKPILHVTFVKKSYQKGTPLSFSLALSGVRFIFLVTVMFPKMTCSRIFVDVTTPPVVIGSECESGSKTGRFDWFPYSSECKRCIISLA